MMTFNSYKYFQFSSVQSRAISVPERFKEDANITLIL